MVFLLIIIPQLTDYSLTDCFTLIEWSIVYNLISALNLYTTILDRNKLALIYDNLYNKYRDEYLDENLSKVTHRVLKSMDKQGALTYVAKKAKPRKVRPRTL